MTILTCGVGTEGIRLSRKFGNKVKVLLVEDHGTTRLAMARLLREAGAEVTSARDGEEGLRLLLGERFDVLLTDLRMPGMDGFELIAQATKLPEWQRPGRVIAISGEYEATALSGVAVGFLAKPFDLDRLLDMLAGKPN
jgi:two-component system chemotaxis response regulator CheY